jgi:hypothetical protein
MNKKPREVRKLREIFESELCRGKFEKVARKPGLPLTSLVSRWQLAQEFFIEENRRFGWSNFPPYNK